jgi:pimeloyl-ACP methyl ester carboxylesterase
VDVSRAAFVDDAAMWIERLCERPAIVVGHSLGGHTAFLLAARRPELVRALVVAEATPSPVPDSPAVLERWVGSWPLPFPTRSAALSFFGGDSLWARAWTLGLEEREDGVWPRFDLDVVLAAVREAALHDHWREWSRVGCPMLVVTGTEGDAARDRERMREAAGGAEVAVVTSAGHDLHLEQPDEWQRSVEPFLLRQSA